MAAARIKYAVVTGAGTGIGKALSLALVARGVRVIAVGRRSAPLEALVKEVKDGEITACSADLTLSSGIETVVSAVKASGSTVDFLVHNAGWVGPIAPLESVKVDDVRKTFDINFFAPLALTQALVPEMTKPGCRILQVSSGAALSAYPSWTAYCTSKAALQMLWKSCNVELGKLGILTGSVRPGIVATPMQGEIRGVDDGDFPMAEMFRNFHLSMEGTSKAAYDEHKIGVAESGAAPPKDALDTPENAAFFMQWLLLSTGADEFAAEEWDIREMDYMHRWAADVAAPGEDEAGPGTEGVANVAAAQAARGGGGE